MSIFIEGLGIAGYRSFGFPMQFMGPFAKINLIAGQNNSGKSNVLLFLRDHLTKAMTAAHSNPSAWTFDATERHRDDKKGELQVAFGLSQHGVRFKGLLAHPGLVADQERASIKKILLSDALTHGTRLTWFSFASSPMGQRMKSIDVEAVRDAKGVEQYDWNRVWQRITGQSGGGLEQHWIPEVLAALAPVRSAPPRIEMIPAIREIKRVESGDTLGDFSGLGLIERLAQLQNPQYGQREKKAHFAQINRFLQSVVGNSTATLEVPHDRRNLIIEIDGHALPLASLGTGIHEVIILAAAATTLENQILCIEEPEIHLHPVLQRKLIRYLATKTTNQYFITTHSAHLLDTPGAAIFHIRFENGKSEIAGAISPSAKAALASDLGYRASDLIQTNCIIWVEGPSDRTYVNAWLKAADSTLIEGTHYSIMFYGGRLLSHLTANDPDIDEFISLRKLNRNLAIVIDSDKKSAHTPINPTKKRVRDEFNRGNGFAWITSGREIENYIKEDVISAAVSAVHPNAVRAGPFGRFDPALAYNRSNGKKLEPDKMRIARSVANESTPDFGVLDLRTMVQKLVKFIRNANGEEV